MKWPWSKPRPASPSKPVVEYRETYWRHTGETRWSTFKQAAGYRVECLQVKYVDFESGEVRWIVTYNERVVRDGVEPTP